MEAGDERWLIAAHEAELAATLEAPSYAVQIVVDSPSACLDARLDDLAHRHRQLEDRVTTMTWILDSASQATCDRIDRLHHRLAAAIDRYGTVERRIDLLGRRCMVLLVASVACTVILWMALAPLWLTIRAR